MKIIEIVIAVPDGVEVDVRTRATPTAEPTYVPPFEDQLIPLPPDAIPIKGDIVNELAAAQVTPFRGAAMQQPPEGCPVHHVPWSVKPAGVSKASGKPYQAFWKCSSQERCDERPSYAWVQAHPIP